MHSIPFGTVIASRNMGLTRVSNKSSTGLTESVLRKGLEPVS